MLDAAATAPVAKLLASEGFTTGGKRAAAKVADTAGLLAMAQAAATDAASAAAHAAAAAKEAADDPAAEMEELKRRLKLERKAVADALDIVSDDDST